MNFRWTSRSALLALVLILGVGLLFSGCSKKPPVETDTSVVEDTPVWGQVVKGYVDGMQATPEEIATAFKAKVPLGRLARPLRDHRLALTRRAAGLGAGLAGRLLPGAQRERPLRAAGRGALGRRRTDLRAAVAREL